MKVPALLLKDTRVQSYIRFRIALAQPLESLPPGASRDCSWTNDVQMKICVIPPLINLERLASGQH